MSKVTNFAEITPNLPYTEFDFYELYRRTFIKTELGRMKSLLPLREMAENMGLINKSMMPKRGRKSYFTPEGKVALMLLSGKMKMKIQQLQDILAKTWKPYMKDQDTMYTDDAMRRIKARRKETEILYIFFGIHTANVVHLAERLVAQRQAEAA